MRKIKNENSGRLRSSSVRLPSGIAFECSRKVRIHHLRDLQLLCLQLNIDADSHYFMVTKCQGERIFTFTYYPERGDQLHTCTAKKFLLYHLCEQYPLRHLNLTDSSDSADVNLISDFVLANKNQLHSNTDESNALNEILNSDSKIIHLINTLLSLSGLSTQWIRVKDHNGKLFQFGINYQGVQIYQDFLDTNSISFSWDRLNRAHASRSILFVFIFMNENEIEKFSNFMTKKRKHSKLKEQYNRQLDSIKPCGDVTDHTHNVELYELKFRLSDSRTAQKLAFQLSSSHRILAKQGVLINKTKEMSSDIARSTSRFSQRFRDSLRRMRKSFFKTPKSSAEPKLEEPVTDNVKTATQETTQLESPSHLEYLLEPQNLDKTVTQPSQVELHQMIDQPKILAKSAVQTTYDNVFVEPIEATAAGEAQAELDEQEEHIIQSLLTAAVMIPSTVASSAPQPYTLSSTSQFTFNQTSFSTPSTLPHQSPIDFHRPSVVTTPQVLTSFGSFSTNVNSKSDGLNASILQQSNSPMVIQGSVTVANKPEFSTNTFQQNAMPINQSDHSHLRTLPEAIHTISSNELSKNLPSNKSEYHIKGDHIPLQTTEDTETSHESGSCQIQDQSMNNVFRKDPLGSVENNKYNHSLYAPIPFDMQHQIGCNDLNGHKDSVGNVNDARDYINRES